MNIELTPQQLDELRLKQIIAHQVKHGEGKQRVSPICGCRINYRKRKTTKELFDTNFKDDH